MHPFWAVVTAFAVVVIGGCGGGGSDEAPARLSPAITVSLHHSDVVYDPSRKVLYVVQGEFSASRVVEVDPFSGSVRDLVAPTDGPPYSGFDALPGTLALSHSARYLYFPTVKGLLTRVNLATRAIDLTLSPSPGVRERASVTVVGASRTDDSVVYVYLRGAGADLDSLGMVRDRNWATQWLDGLSRTNTGYQERVSIREDDSELILSRRALNRVRLTLNGVDAILASSVDDPLAITQAVPQWVSDGILWGRNVYDGTTSSLLFEIPGASRCFALPSKRRVVCTETAGQTGHVLFVFDLPTRSRVFSRLAGFDTGSPSATTPALLITPAGSGRVAVSYGSTARGFSFGARSLSVYVDPAFD